MRKFLVLVIFGFYLGLFAQPKAFIKSDYENYSKNMKSEEKVHYKKYKALYDSMKISTYYDMSDLFYHCRINLKSFNKFKVIGRDLINGAKDIYDKPYEPTLLSSQIVFIGTLIEANDKKQRNNGSYQSYLVFSVDSILKGSYYYKQLPKTVKCYTDATFEGINNKNEIVKIPQFYGIKLGGKCYVYCSKNNPILLENSQRKPPKDISEANVFEDVACYSYDKFEISTREAIEETIRKIEELNYEEIFNSSRREGINGK